MLLTLLAQGLFQRNQDTKNHPNFALLAHSLPPCPSAADLFQPLWSSRLAGNAFAEDQHQKVCLRSPLLLLTKGCAQSCL